MANAGMTEEEAKKITEAFVGLSIQAFKGDEMAQRAVLAYQEWFHVAKRVTAVLGLLGGLRG